MPSVLLRRAIGVVMVAVTLATAAGCRSDDGAGAGAAAGADAGAATAGRPSDGAASAAATPTPPKTLPTSVPRAPITIVAAPPAPDPATAVGTFVRAEVERDAGQAWSMLSAADRLRYPNPAMWQTEHRQIPQLTGATLTGAATPVTVAGTLSAAFDLGGDVSFVPTLDTTKGLVPARAAATWRVVRENGGWRVSYSESRFSAQYPDDEDATTAATSWARARQQCRPTGDEADRTEVVGGVVGISGLADRLCGTTGDIVANGIAQPIVTTDATAVIAAFGPGAAEWARVVSLGGPAPQRVVLGPLGDRWIAIGVLEPS